MKEVNYTRQIYRVNDDGTPLVGLCNVSSMANLLNRKCEENAFTAKDVISQVTSKGILAKYPWMHSEAIEKTEALSSRKDLYGTPCDGYCYEGDTAKVYRISYDSGDCIYKAIPEEKPTQKRVTELLKAHPEGLFAYFHYAKKENSNRYHAVVITRLDETGEFWVLDPMSIPKEGIVGSDSSPVVFDPFYGQRLTDSWLGQEAQWSLWGQDKLIRISYLK